MTNSFDEFELIHSYSRKQAIEDGMLVNVSKLAKDTGFKIPVAITAELWHGLIVPKRADEELGQSTRGRLLDVLTMLHYAIRNNKDTDIIIYKVIFLISGKQEPHELKAIVGPDDDLSPCLTIMMKNED